MLVFRILENYNMKEFFKSCQENRPLSGIEAIQRTLNECVNATVDTVILDLMAKYVGYKYSIEDKKDEPLEHYTRLYYHLKLIGHEETAKELEYLVPVYEEGKSWQYSHPINGVLKEMNLRAYLPYDTVCTFEHSLVRHSFKRKLVLNEAVTIASHLLQLAFQGTMCAYVTQKNDTVEAALRELEEGIKTASELLKEVTPKMLNSTWLYIQKQQIREEIEEIPEKQIEQTNLSFENISRQIYEKQAEVGHPDYTLQLLVVPYSSENVDNSNLR